MDQHVKKIVWIFTQLQTLGLINQRQYDILKKTVEDLEFSEYIKAEITESYIRKYMSDKKNYCWNDHTLVWLFNSVKDKKEKYIKKIKILKC